MLKTEMAGRISKLEGWDASVEVCASRRNFGDSASMKYAMIDGFGASVMGL